MIYRLLALNIDGTLLQSNGRMHRSTKEAVDYVCQKGIYVTLVTSRSFPSAKKVAKALKLDSILVTHRGGYICKTSAGKPSYVQRIPEAIAFDIVRFLEGFPCQIRLVHEKFSLANKFKLNHNLLAKTVFTTGDPVLYSQQFVDSIGDTLLDTPMAPPKIEIYFDSKKDLLDAQAALHNMFNEIGTVKLNDWRLDIIPAEVSKLNGLLWLGDRLGIAANEMVAIADDPDDKELLKTVGLGVAMGNAPVELKQTADWITRSNNQHGVAYMIKEHFRKQQPIEFLRKMNIIK
ncbi:HAD family phosphatase [Bacillaceae bacterium Marseille-Q3522]|nr:HAD family phosphatase [Bacillaceae bacterium Marseille-Q3522]